MLGLKDIETLKSLSAILCIPLFAAAYIASSSQSFSLENQDALIKFFLDNSSHNLQLVGKTLYVVISVIITTVAFFIFDYLAIWIEVRTNGLRFFFWLGIIFLTAGLFIFSYIAPNQFPKSPLNPFWHMAFLAYGFTLLERSAQFDQS